MGSIVLLDLMGGVALLLWGLHMVLTGVLRIFRGTWADRYPAKQYGDGTDDYLARCPIAW
jgi:hypothetical protein